MYHWVLLWEDQLCTVCVYNDSNIMRKGNWRQLTLAHVVCNFLMVILLLGESLQSFEILVYHMNSQTFAISQGVLSLLSLAVRLASLATSHWQHSNCPLCAASDAIINYMSTQEEYATHKDIPHSCQMKGSLFINSLVINITLHWN